ncbi:hypothetical protein MKW92_047671, partial [Papaver armeniacum]
MAETCFYSTLIPNFSKPISSIRRTTSVSPTTILKRNSISCSSISTTTTSNDSSTITANKKIPWGCDVDSLENASLLQSWLTESGLPEQRMAIRKVDVGERGLVALKNIRKGEKLLFVPPSLVISADSEWSCPEAGEVLKRILLLRWSNYISALPRQPYSLLYWTRSELDTYLVASQIRERAIERINNVTGTFEAQDFSKYPHLFPEEVFNMETFKMVMNLKIWRFVLNPNNLNY